MKERLILHKVLLRSTKNDKNKNKPKEKNLKEYGAFIILLVRGYKKAQNSMRTSGCLSYLIRIAECLLDWRKSKEYFFDGSELIIYAILSCMKNPWNTENQNQAGRLIPRVLDYIHHNSQMGCSCSEIIKCLWSFLRNSLYRNDRNQRMFIDSSGSIVLFRNLQNIMEKKRGTDSEPDDLIDRITASMIELKWQQDFIRDASNFCCITILAKVAETCCGTSRHRAAAFLDVIAREARTYGKSNEHERCEPRDGVICTNHRIADRLKKILCFSNSAHSKENCRFSKCESYVCILHNPSNS